MSVNQLCVGDNLTLLKSYQDEVFDLIYIDPPFYSGVDYGEFNDVWKSLNYYLAFMDSRIRQIYRVLKKTGSFYLHCDASAVYDLKPLCDDIFGRDKFRREIIWTMGSVSGFKSRAKNWIRNHDTILFYTKSDKFIFNKYYLPYSQEYIDKMFRYEDEQGKYRKRGKGKQYLHESKGFPISDVWDDIKSFQTRTRSSEYTNYSTQKPEKLIERIVLASSNRGDLIGDFFMGSGTTVAVAKRLGRNYIGCDINEKAVDIAEERISKINKCFIP